MTKRGTMAIILLFVS